MGKIIFDLGETLVDVSLIEQASNDGRAPLPSSLISQHVEKDGTRHKSCLDTYIVITSPSSYMKSVIRRMQADNLYRSSVFEFLEQSRGIAKEDRTDNEGVREDSRASKRKFGAGDSSVATTLPFMGMHNEDIVPLNSYHYSHIKEKLSQNGIGDLKSASSVDTATADQRTAFVIEIFPINSPLKGQQYRIVDLGDGLKCFMSITLGKDYNASERTKREEEITSIKGEGTKRESEKTVLAKLRCCVSSWDTIALKLPYFSLFPYCPLTSEHKATEEEWEGRKLVWNFKNNPSMTTERQHEQALADLWPRLTSLFQTTFGEDLKWLTLVCVPASSAAKNKARYKLFSEKLADATGMNNAYEHIQIIEDATPKHMGGTGTPILYFDEDYFKGRTVILFDDIITKGRTMLRFKRKLEILGANVIAGVSIGRTILNRTAEIVI